MDVLFLHVGLLVLPILALRLASILLRSEAGIRRPSRMRVLLPTVVAAVLAGISLASLIGWIFLGLPDFRISVAGNPLAVLLLFAAAASWLVPAFRWFQRDWPRLAHDREESWLPEGEIYRSVPVDVGSLLRVNLVVDGEGVHLAARGLEGVGCAPVCVGWGEFTTFKLLERRGTPELESVLLDGSVVVFYGAPASRIAQELKGRRA